MYDQNDQQGQMGQPQDNNPYGQLPTNDNNGMGGDPGQPMQPPAQPDNPPLTPAEPSQQPAPVAGDDLLAIKQDALQQLNPLVEHLDQSPEEKFKTTMMMIQASDDQSLIRTAYDTAKQIQDEKARAQALLDVVNEINYFTQQNNN